MNHWPLLFMRKHWATNLDLCPKRNLGSVPYGVPGLPPRNSFVGRADGCTRNGRYGAISLRERRWRRPQTPSFGGCLHTAHMRAGSLQLFVCLPRSRYRCNEPDYCMQSLHTSLSSLSLCHTLPLPHHRSFNVQLDTNRHCLTLFPHLHLFRRSLQKQWHPPRRPQVRNARRSKTP